MATPFLIPLKQATPQKLSVALNNATYNLRVYYAYTFPSPVDGGWFLDISDINNNPLACGIALVPGLDLLIQYGYLGIGGALFVQDSGDWTKPPTFDSLGGAGTAQLYFITTAVT